MTYKYRGSDVVSPLHISTFPLSVLIPEGSQEDCIQLGMQAGCSTALAVQHLKIIDGQL